MRLSLHGGCHHFAQKGVEPIDPLNNLLGLHPKAEILIAVVVVVGEDPLCKMIQKTWIKHSLLTETGGVLAGTSREIQDQNQPKIKQSLVEDRDNLQKHLMIFKVVSLYNLVSILYVSYNCIPILVSKMILMIWIRPFLLIKKRPVLAGAQEEIQHQNQLQSHQSLVVDSGNLQKHPILQTNLKVV